MRTKGRKPKIQKQESQKPKEDIQPCQVCGCKIFDEALLDRLTCSSCLRTVHRNCYFPQFKKKDKSKWKCDECKKRNSNKSQSKDSCAACGKLTGILKYIGNDNGNSEFMHVLCALATPKIQLLSYKSLTFQNNGFQKHKKKINSQIQCINCKNDRLAGLRCSIDGCEAHFHLDCLISYSYQTAGVDNLSPPFLTIGLLNKHENSLLSHLSEDLTPFPYLKMMNLPIKSINYLVCSEHNDETSFIWCPCGIQNLQDQSNQCEKCKRWLHNNCMKKEEQNCKGCRNNDIYKIYAKLPQLIQKAVEIENLDSLHEETIKFLDHFCLKLSQSIYQQVIKYAFNIERYYLRKFLQNIQQTKQQTNISILQILYYLQNKSIKKQNEITICQIEKLIDKKSKFHHGDKQEKVQKKYIRYLEDRLKQMQKDDSKEVRLRIKDFIRKSNDMSRTDKQLANDIFEIVKMIEKSEKCKQCLNTSESIQNHSQNRILEFFCQIKLSEEEIVDLLESIRIIFNCKSKGFISEDNFNDIQVKTLTIHAEQKRRAVQQLIQVSLKHIPIKRKYHEKSQLKASFEINYMNCTNLSTKKDIQRQLFFNGILVQPHSIFIQSQKNNIELEIRKRRILTRFRDPSPSQLQQAIIAITELLQFNSQVGLLTDKQVHHLESSKTKYIFYNNFIKYSSNYKELNIFQQRMEEEKQNNEYQLEQQNKKCKLDSASQSVAKILMIWDLQIAEHAIFGVNQMNILYKFNVQFEENQFEVIFGFGEHLINHVISEIQLNKMCLTSSLLDKLCQIIMYLKLQDNYSFFIDIQKKYLLWKRQLDTNFIDIQKVLEKEKLVNELLIVIETMQIEAQDLDIDLKSDLRKLKILKMWALLSQKLLPRYNKATITSIQQIKGLMDSIRYPVNSIRAEVEKLQIESRQLNKRISKFLQKPKPIQMQIYEELKFMSKKMTIEQGKDLKNDLQHSLLDVQFELQELNEEISQYKKFPQYIDENSSLDDLLALRRKILDNAFIYQNMDTYQYLLSRIIQLKCKQFQVGNPITKKDYFKFINLGGQAGALFYAETMPLYKAYKQIEKAETQISGSKPKSQNLLPIDCNKIKASIKDDAIEKGKIDRWCINSDRLRERFRVFKYQRVQLQRYIALQSELVLIPINNRDIVLQISKIKKDLNELIGKARNIYIELKSQVNNIHIQSPFISDLIAKYRLCPARTEFLDKFEEIYQKNRKIMELSKFICPENYKEFSNCCMDIAQLSKNQYVYYARKECFNKISQDYLQSPDPLTEVGYTLLAEGGALCKYPNEVAEILQRMMQVNSKFNKWGIRQVHGEDNEQERNELSEQINEANSSQDSSDEQHLDLQDLDDDDFQDESPSSSNRKRPRPPNEIVDLDDD